MSVFYNVQLLAKSKYEKGLTTKGKENLLERIKNSQTTLTLIVATIILIPIEVVLFYAGVLVSINQTASNATFVLTDYGVWYLSGFAVLPILYCIAASLFFSPKRIVSPLNIQIFAWMTFAAIEFLHMYNTLYIGYYIPTTSMINTMFSQWVFVAFILCFVFIFAGFVQLFIVRLVVGPNLIGVSRKTYFINANFKIVDDVIGKVEDYRRKEESDGYLVYKMPIGFVDSVLMVIGSDANDKNQSILATVAYTSGIYSYQQTDASGAIRDKTVFEIEGRLRHVDSPAIIKESKDELCDPISMIAYDLAIKPTRTPFKRTEKLVSQIPYFYKAVMVVTFILILIVQFAFFTPYIHIDTNTWISTTILLVFAFLAEAVIPLRDEIQQALKKK